MVSLLMGKGWFLFWNWWLGGCVLRKERIGCVCVCVFLYHSNENYSALPVLFVAIQASEEEYFQV